MPTGGFRHAQLARGISLAHTDLAMLLTNKQNRKTKAKNIYIQFKERKHSTEMMGGTCRRKMKASRIKVISQRTELSMPWNRVGKD